MKRSILTVALIAVAGPASAQFLNPPPSTPPGPPAPPAPESTLGSPASGPVSAAPAKPLSASPPPSSPLPAATALGWRAVWSSVPLHARSARRRVLYAGSALALLAGTCLSAVTAQAQDATWLLNPGSGDFDTPGNWTPPTVPAGTATFNQSNTTTLGFSAPTAVNTLQFNAGAPA